MVSGMDGDDAFVLAMVAIVLGMLTIMVTCTDGCRLDAYGTCMRNAAEPEQCERLLPKEWQK